MNTEEMLNVLLDALWTESKASANITIPEDSAGKWRLLRALMNIRPPAPVRAELLELQDRVLTARCQARGVTCLESLQSIQMEVPGTRMPFAERLVLWRGDITTLVADAIVNAANDRLLGCFIPHHRCIDNAIHSAAGMQHPQATLVRINLDDASVPGEITAKSIAFQQDIAQVMQALVD